MASKTSSSQTPAWRVKSGTPAPQLSSSSSSAPSWRNGATPTSSLRPRTNSSGSTSSSSTSSSTTTSSSSSSSSGTKGAAWTTNSSWRAASPPKASPPKASGTPDYTNLVEGQVLFLPNSGVPQNSIFWNKKNGGSPSGHPVVVIGKFKKANGEECVRFRTLTTFGGQSLETKKPAHQWRYFMLCECRNGTPAGPGAQTATFEAGSGVLAKRSYINLSPNSIYEIEYTHLEVFNGQSSLRFNKTSTSSIQSH